jgi:hypothetical protein
MWLTLTAQSFFWHKSLSFCFFKTKLNTKFKKYKGKINMKELTNYGSLAYQKAEDLENSIAGLKHKVHMLEILYGTTPPQPDPNDTEDEPYLPPAPNEVITTGDIATVPVYYSSTAAITFPFLYFTAHANSTIIIKLNLELVILANPCTLLIELFVDDNLFDSYTLSDPVEAAYTIPFANSYISSEVGHKICYKITPSVLYSCTYKVATAKYEILGNNIDFLNAPKKHSVYYMDGIYYLSKCEQGESSYLIKSISALNINADYTTHQTGAIEQKFCSAYQRINSVWQPTYLGYLYKLGNGASYIKNYEDPSKFCNLSYTHGFEHLPNLSTYYGGIAIFTSNLGNLHYNDVTVEFNSAATRTIESGGDYYVNVAGVKFLHDNFNTYPQKAKFIATRLDGTNVFFSEVRNYYKLELGYGTNVHSFYNEDCTTINVFMKVYNQIVKNVLTLNTSTNRYELTSSTAIGTWHEYILGAPPAYFTVTNNLLSYNVS